MRATALLAALLCAVPVLSQSLLTVYHTDAAPVLDGELAEACWQAASVSSPFLSNADRGYVTEQTHVRVCWDESYLYFGVEAFESLLDPKLNMLHLVKAEMTGRDVPVWLEDSIDIFLQPPGHVYYHFAANSGTGAYEAEGLIAAWNCDWRCVARRTESCYILEMAIPLEPLDGQPAGEWRVNFARNRSFSKELSTWSGLQGSFHQPEAWGTLRFARNGPALGPVAMVREEAVVRLSATVGGDADEDTLFQARLTAGEAATSAEARGAGSHDLAIVFPEAAYEMGEYVIAYALLQRDKPVAEAPPTRHAVAAGLAHLALTVQQATTRVTLNGITIETGAGSAWLELRGGLNVLAIEASAVGNEPGVRPLLEASGRPLSVSWLGRGDEPPADWRETIAAEGWSAAITGPRGLWAPGATDRCFLVAGLVVGDCEPQLFPKTDTFYIPRASRQLLKIYLHPPHDTPDADYSMIVEAPYALRLIGTEPISGGEPQVTEAGTVEVGGQALKRHRLAYEAPPGDGMELSMCWCDARGETIVYLPGITSGGTHGWRHLSATLKPPPDARLVRPLIIKWQGRRIQGTFWVDNVSLRESPDGPNLLTIGSFDEPEWNDWQIVPEAQDGSRCVRIAVDPAATDHQQAIWVIPGAGGVPVDPDKEYLVELDVRCEGLGSLGFRGLCGLLFEAPSEMAEGELPLFTYLERQGGAVIEFPQRSRVVVLPPLRNVRPERVRICPCYYGSQFSNPTVAEAYADNCYASGITWTYGGYANDVVPFLADRGHHVFWSISWEPWSAPSALKDFITEHPELQAVDFQGQPITHTFCPTWVLTEGTQVTDALEKWFLDTVNQTPYDGANWDLEQPVVDPPTFCTCLRCLEACREFANLPADAALNAETILATYREPWITFRCAQNAEMAGKLKAIFAKAARPIEFSMYSGYQCTKTREHYGVDWSLLAPHLDLAIAGYGGDRSAIQATMQALNGVPFMGGDMWYLSDRNDEWPTPRMEMWRNRILRQFAESGGNGCLIWWLPTMDGGAFYATSEAAEIIAQYEGFFTLKQRCDEKVQVTGLDPRNWLAFEKDGQVLVMLLNFGAEPISTTLKVGEREEQAEIEGYGVRVIVLG